MKRQHEYGTLVFVHQAPGMKKHGGATGFDEGHLGMDGGASTAGGGYKSK